MSEAPPNLSVSQIMDMMIEKDFTEFVFGQLMLKRDSTSMSRYNLASAVFHEKHADKSGPSVSDTMAPPPNDMGAEALAKIKEDEEALLYASAGG